MFFFLLLSLHRQRTDCSTWQALPLNQQVGGTRTAKSHKLVAQSVANVLMRVYLILNCTAIASKHGNRQRGGQKGSVILGPERKGRPTFGPHYMCIGCGGALSDTFFRGLAIAVIGPGDKARIARLLCFGNKPRVCAVCCMLPHFVLLPRCCLGESWPYEVMKLL